MVSIKALFIKGLLLILILSLIPYPSNAYFLYGRVLDEQDNVVPFAEVKIECQNYSKILETDRFGSFYIELTKKPCIASARYENNVGFKEINSVAQDIAIDIKADKLILKTRVYYYVIFSIFILGLIILIYLRKKKFKSPKLNKLFNLLNEREKIILNEILKQKGKTTQAKLYYITKIPKVSLSRYIKLLENKKLIKTESLGKLKRVELSKNFKKLL